MKKSRKIWWTALACTTLTCGVIGLTGCFNFNAGDNSGDSSAEEHTHEYHCEVISPTCTEGGENVYSCSCGDSYSEPLEALGHDYVDAACSRCGEVQPSEAIYSLNEDEKGYCVVGVELKGTNDVVILSEYEGLPVTDIGENAFFGTNNLTGITIPASVKKIAAGAFLYCNTLTDVRFMGDVADWCSIQFADEYANPMRYAQNLYIENKLIEGELVIPDGVAVINNGAFYNCANITNIKFPDSVIRIEENAFNNCKNLINVEFPNRLERIGEDAFRACGNLESVVLPVSVKRIEDSAFDNCSNLADVYYTGNIEEWCAMEFGNLDANPALSAANFYIDNKLIEGELIIPDNITDIKAYTFAGRSAVTNLTLPASVRKVGSYAFYGCSNIENVYYMGDVEGWCAIEFKDSTPLYEAEHLYIDNTLLAGELVIPDSVEHIKDYAFYYCDELTSVTLGKGVKTIGKNAFYGCGVVNVEIPEGVTEIGAGAFSLCHQLKRVVIPEGVDVIKFDTFAHCSSLTSVVIPDSVKSIEANAFAYCVELTDITIGDGVRSITGRESGGGGGSAFYNTGYYNDETNWEDGVLYIDKYLIEAKETLVGEYAVKEGTLCIGNSAFSYCGVTSVILPDSVRDIGNSAFFSCEQMTSLQMSKDIQRIGDDAFNYCTKLATVEIPEGITEIGERTFSYCDSLQSVVIPNSVTRIGKSAFEECNGLTSITIPFVGEAKDGEYNTHFGYIFGGFAGSVYDTYIPQSLQEVVISGGSIAADAFAYCGNLTNVVILDGVTVIEDRAFMECSHLTNVTIGKGVKSIGALAFYNCTALETISLADGVKNIGESAFAYCGNVTDIIIPHTVKNIGESAFKDWISLTAVYYKGGVGYWEEISVGAENTALLGAKLYYYTVDEPVDGWDWWHYAEDGVTPVIWTKD